MRRVSGGHETNIDADRALELVLGAARPLEPVSTSAWRAMGAVLTEDVVADGDYPPFDRAMMDGYAVRLTDAGRALPVAGEVAAGHAPTEALPHGAVVAVMTGSVCPEGTEAVVPLEETEGGEGSVRLPGNIAAGQNVARRGSECRAGATVLWAGQAITPLRLALLATVGRTAVQVRRPPTMAIITTGDEVVPADQAPTAGRIRGSNGPMLAALAAAAGVQRLTRVHVRDDAQELREALERAAEVDVVLLSGGVSAGRFDLVPGAVRAAGGQVVFHGVRQKPGKPLLFATRGRQLVFGLPGNPLAVQLGFHRYVGPTLRAMLGLGREPPGGTGRLSVPWAVRGERTQFQLCGVAWGGEGWEVTPLAGRGSADLFTAAAAQALVRFEPAGEPYPAGTEVRFEWLQGAERPPGLPSGPAPAAASGTYGLLAPIATRRSLRAFDPEPPPERLLARALNAARWAPSAGNGQPWRFVVAARGGPAFTALAGTLRPGNAWATGAPYLVLVAAKTHFEHPEKPPKPNELALLEVGQALANLMVQATSDGLVAHPFDGFDAERAAEAVAVPGGYRVAVMLAIGRPGDPGTLDERARAKDARPRERLPLQELVFMERWAVRAPWAAADAG